MWGTAGRCKDGSVDGRVWSSTGVLENSGHPPSWEQPDQFVDYLAGTVRAEPQVMAEPHLQMMRDA